ncbi:class B sortase [Ruminococcus gauvreauii]|uniref:class B sortase n=1 Tax=Ruminococcus gauvreauii TaxID=438033 RepID=UPI0039842BFE
MKNNKYRILFGAFLIVFLAAAGFCVYYYTTQKQKEQVYEELAKEVKATPEPTPSAEPEKTPEATEEPTPEPTPEAVIPIDFDKLWQRNADIYAWIQIPDTVVDYPILQSAEDNLYYLNHTVDGAEGLPGSIYTENINRIDFTDKNTVIYGHNMNDGSMFGGLHQYVDPAYMEAHPDIRIYTPEYIYTYRVFAAVTYDNRHILGQYDCNEEPQFQAFLDSVMSVRNIASHFSSETTATVDDRIITLSTCNGNSEQRFLVEAVLINEE